MITIAYIVISTQNHFEFLPCPLQANIASVSSSHLSSSNLAATFAMSGTLEECLASLGGRVGAVGAGGERGPGGRQHGPPPLYTAKTNWPPPADILLEPVTQPSPGPLSSSSHNGPYPPHILPPPLVPLPPSHLPPPPAARRVIQWRRVGRCVTDARQRWRLGAASFPVEYCLTSGDTPPGGGCSFGWSNMGLTPTAPVLTPGLGLTIY